MHAGKPLKQSLAIAYAMKRKKAQGGEVEHEEKQTHEELAQPMEDRLDMHEASQLRGREKMSRHARALMAAMGGQIQDNYQSPGHAHLTHPDLKNEEQDEYDPKEEPHPKHNMIAAEEDEHKLGEHGEYEEGPEGPHIDAKDPEHEYEHAVENQGKGVEEDMVGRIIKQRGHVFAEGGNVEPDETEPETPNAAKKISDYFKSGAPGAAKGGEAHMCSGGSCPHYSHGGPVKHMSKGGRVANQDEEITDDMPAEYDDLHLDDHLDDDGKANYTGKNSGDELDDEQEDKDRKNIVSRIMHSRAKKDRMPRPA